jgi:spore coat protein CotH
MHEAIYENLIQEYIPALSVNYVHLYLNNSDFGLYTNVQQLDKTFLKEWFLTNDGTLWRAERTDGAIDADPGGANGTGFSTLNYLGTDTSVYKNYYTLKETNKINPWDDLIEVCDPLNNSPANQLEDTINTYLDLDRTLWYMVCEILFTDEDSYVQ